MEHDFRLTDDGRIGLTIERLLSVPLTHLMSGLDEDADDCADGASSVWTGYTEWIGEVADTTIVLGWDIEMGMQIGQGQWSRSGAPRSNICLLAAVGDAYPWEKNLVVLGTVIDALVWQQAVAHSIEQRYR
ncbi:DUF4902 domain-containing protein [Burkholderia sp. MR1-5-21]